jgi:hypothetical protein
MLICPVGAKLLHVDRQTDMAKLIVTFHSFMNVPRKSVSIMSEWLSPLLHDLG